MADKGPTIQLQVERFNQMLAELAAIDPAVEFRTVVRAEAAAVVATGMSGTRAAKVADIRRRASAQKVITFGGKVYFLENRFPDELWAGIRERRDDSLKTKLGSRGMAKQSWLHLARSMRHPLKAPAYVVSANYRGKQFPEDGSSTEVGGGQSFSLTIVNSSPIVQKARGERALANAMSRRARYFERNMEHHFFRTVESRAKKYPGIFTSPVPPALSSPNEVPVAT